MLLSRKTTYAIKKTFAIDISNKSSIQNISRTLTTQQQKGKEHNFKIDKEFEQTFHQRK